MHPSTDTEGGASANDTVASAAPLTSIEKNGPTRFLSPHYRINFPSLTHHQLSFNDVDSWPDDPMQVFAQWYMDGESAYNKLSPDRMDGPVHWPNTMQISTVSTSGFPSVRTVLLKGFDSRGLVFFTNYSGRKGQELTANPRCALNFYWKTLERQVRVEGIAERVSAAESDAYFRIRPLASALSGTVSPQSRPIPSRSALERAYVSTVVAVAKQIKKAVDKDGGAIDAEVRQDTKQKVSSLLAELSVQAGESGSSSASPSPTPSPSPAAPSTPSVTIYHNQRCSNSRGALELIRSAGVEPVIVNYLDTPPSKQQLHDLITRAGLSVREAIRTKEKEYTQLGLESATDDQLLDAMVSHPILINRPLVVTERGVRLCRPPELVKQLLTTADTTVPAAAEQALSLTQPFLHDHPSSSESSSSHHAHAVALASLQSLESSSDSSRQLLLHSLITRPPYWGGFLIRPLAMEFWCDGKYRLHSRIVYERKDRTADKKEAGSMKTSQVEWKKTFLAP